MKISILHDPTDADLSRECQVHLAMLQRSGHTILRWSIEGAAGALEADVILLLLSARMIAWWISSPVAMAIDLRSKERRLRLIPVALRSCDVEAVENLQAVPRDPPPIVERADRDAAWAEVDREVRAVLREIEAGGGR